MSLSEKGVQGTDALFFAQFSGNHVQLVMTVVAVYGDVFEFAATQGRDARSGEGNSDFALK